MLSAEMSCLTSRRWATATHAGGPGRPWPDVDAVIRLIRATRKDTLKGVDLECQSAEATLAGVPPTGAEAEAEGPCFCVVYCCFSDCLPLPFELLFFGLPAPAFRTKASITSHHIHHITPIRHFPICACHPCAGAMQCFMFAGVPRGFHAGSTRLPQASARLPRASARLPRASAQFPRGFHGVPRGSTGAPRDMSYFCVG